jgi:hypothetical protein
MRDCVWDGETLCGSLGALCTASVLVLVNRLPVRTSPRPRHTHILYGTTLRSLAIVAAAVVTAPSLPVQGRGAGAGAGAGAGTGADRPVGGGKKPGWEAKSSALREAMKAARMYAAAKASGM